MFMGHEVRYSFTAGTRARLCRSIGRYVGAASPFQSVVLSSSLSREIPLTSGALERSSLILVHGGATLPLNDVMIIKCAPHRQRVAIYTAGGELTILILPITVDLGVAILVPGHSLCS